MSAPRARRGVRLGDRRAREPDAVARGELGEERNVHSGNVRDPRIAAQRLRVRHEYDRVAVRGDLDRAGSDRRRDQLGVALPLQRAAVEADAHPV